MNENRAILFNKGIKRLLALIALMIISPISLNIAFKALNKLDNNNWIAYALLLFAMLATIFTLVLAFKTFKLFLDALFYKNNAE
ncbi:MAG: hypothetical protein HWD85_01840 [Flavobacteriaceae bacterium]|nr:hypothetical protein [Flavobacteriaceae bacterium]